MGHILFKGPSIDGLYPIQPSTIKSAVNNKIIHPQSFAVVAHSGTKNSSTMWHNRLGHPHLQSLNSILRLLNLPSCTTLPSVSEPCLFGKMHKVPFPKSYSTFMSPLELLHSDVWCPAPEISINGFCYYVSFVDDMTIYTWLFPISQKSDVFSVFKRFKPLVENMFSTRIKNPSN